MALSTRRRGGSDNGLSPWPGYVDALSTLLMVIIFVLLVFVLAQAFLSVALSGRDKQLDRVNRQLAEVSDMLALERGHGADLQQSIAQLNRELAATSAARDTLSQQLAALKEQAERAGANRDTLRGERDRLTQQLADAGLQAQSGAARVEQLQKDLTASAGRTDAARQETASVATQLADTRRQLSARAQQLADAQSQLADMQRQMAELDKTVKADKETITARQSDLAKLAEQNRALAALRDTLEKQAQDAAARAMTDQQRRAAVEIQLADEKRLGDSARAQIVLLNQQVDALKAQLTSIAKALDVAQTQGRDKDVQIDNLAQKLNAALSAKVEELQRYRSEFFGKLRDVLANRPGIQIVGDRFVFQSEVLFPVGSAELTPAGLSGITALAVTIKDVAAEIPPDIHWIMRIDGHTDRQPIKPGGPFASNWELSAARAITVVKLLIADGVPAEHLAATGFADNEPLDPDDTPEAYAKNRRIELRLTDR
jgi:chemotaxis protein MotB